MKSGDQKEKYCPCKIVKCPERSSRGSNLVLCAYTSTVDEVVTGFAGQDLALAEGTCGSTESNTGETRAAESQYCNGQATEEYLLGSD